MRKILWSVMSNVLAMTTAIFFHEPSSFQFVINAEEVDKNTSFGYSLSYQKKLNTLVVGAPNEQTGKVFTCPLDLDTAKEKIISTCQRYDAKQYIEKDLMDTKRVDENYQFMLGTSVAALDNSFVTCAPKWTSTYDEGFSIWGACFKIENNNKKISIFDGLYKKLRKDVDLRGNFGWRMLADDINGIILISKPSSHPLRGDILYIKQENPLESMESLLVYDEIQDKNKNKNKNTNKYKNKNIYTNNLAHDSNLGTAMASGKFFDDKNALNSQLYAIGLVNSYIKGQVLFLRLNLEGTLEIIMDSTKEIIKLATVDDETEDTGINLGSLFGASLCGARLNEDEYTDLIVGAPAQTDSDKNEMGAVHIYTGDILMENFMQIKLKIMGHVEGSRFGSTIAAHNLDSDGLQEIFISALNEKEGVLYIISGYEMNEKLKNSTNRPVVDVRDFASIQMIESEGFKLLGFSITPVSDLDENGCDEIAVGSPGSDRIMILRCIPTVEINVTAKLLGYEKIPVTVNDFQIEVCINLQYMNSTIKNIAAHVTLNNTIEAEGVSTGIVINDADHIFDFNLHNKTSQRCQNISVNIVDIRAENKNYTNYKFKTAAKLITDADNATTFNRAWVRTSPYSTLTNVLKIKRECIDDDCDYNLKIDMIWSGGEIADNPPFGTYLVAGQDESLTMQISNEGKPIFDAYVMIQVRGVAITKAGCSETKEGYKCYLPQPFKKNEKRTYLIKLKTSQLNNELTSFNVTAVLYDDNRLKVTEKYISIDYKFDATGISVIGHKSNPSITEKSIKSESETIDVEHTYMIENTQTILWKNVIFTLNVSNDEEQFIKELKVSTQTCTSEKPVYMSCSVDLKPNSKIKVMVTVILWKKEIEKSLMHKKLNVKTELLLNLVPTSVQLSAKAESTPVFQTDTSIGQNKALIISLAVIVALIIIAVCIVILYKSGFFKRKQELQAEIRRRSVKRSNLTSVRNDSLVEIIEEEDIEDNVFPCDDIPANVHSERISRRVSRRSTADNEEMGKQQRNAVKDEKDQ